MRKKIPRISTGRRLNKDAQQQTREARQKDHVVSPYTGGLVYRPNQKLRTGDEAVQYGEPISSEKPNLIAGTEIISKEELEKR